MRKPHDFIIWAPTRLVPVVKPLPLYTHVNGAALFLLPHAQNANHMTLPNGTCTFSTTAVISFSPPPPFVDLLYEQEAGPEGDAGGGPAKKAKRVEGSKDDIFGEVTAKGRKRTEEGFAIYTEDELGLGRKGGGDTDLCPFDCECCF